MYMKMPARLSEIINDAPLLVVGIDGNGQIEYANSYACEITGLSADEMAGRHFWDLMPEGTARRTERFFTRLKADSIPVEYEGPIKTATSEDPVIEWRTTVARTETGNIDQILAIGLDVTERRQARDRAEHLTHLLAAIRDVNQIIVREQDTDTLLRRACDSLVANRGYAYVWMALFDEGQVDHFYGAPEYQCFDEFARDLQEGWHPPCVTMVNEQGGTVTVEPGIAECEACKLQHFGENAHGLVTRLEHRDNDYGVFAVRVPSGMEPDDEEISLFNEVADDISFALASIEAEREHREADRQLEEQRELLEAFFRHTVTPVALLDTDFNFIRVNRAYAEADDREPEFFEGRNHFDLYPSDAEEIFKQVRDTGEPYYVEARPFEYAANPERGTTYWNWSLVPVDDQDDEVEMLVFTLRDVTEQERAKQELVKRQEDLRSLAAELARTEQQERRRIASELHDELGQTLAFMKIKISELRSSCVQDEVGCVADELTELVEEAVAFTRAMQFELSPPILYELGLEAAAEWLGEQFEDRHGLDVTVEAKGISNLGQDMQIMLFQAIQELLNNVVKHSGAGEARVMIESNEESTSVTVEDNGEGFDPDAVEMGPREQQGFGLFNIVERLRHSGGSADIDSTPGEGTRIRLVAPASNTSERDVAK